MASEKQKAASRANCTRARGPVAPEGQLRARRRPLVQTDAERGMLARMVVPGSESLPRFHALMTSLQEEIKPETPIENLLIHKMAVAQQRLMRVWGMQRSGASHAVRKSGPPESPDAPTRDALAFGQSGVHLNEYKLRFDCQYIRTGARRCACFKKFRASRTRHVQQTKTPGVQR